MQRSDAATRQRAGGTVPWPLALWRIGRVAGHALAGLAIVTWRFPVLDAAAREARVGRWSQGLLRALGVTLQQDGAFAAGPHLVTPNHVSWLDIVAIHAVAPHVRFVSKADVRDWPLLRRLVDAGGTIYLQRENRRDALRVVHTIADALGRDGQSVAVFPEGTTGPGQPLLPFHANLLQAAIAAGRPVQPVAIRYDDAAGPFSDAARFVGDTTLLQSLWRLARGRALVVHVRPLAPLPTHGAARRDLAGQVRAVIAAALGA